MLVESERFPARGLLQRRGQLCHPRVVDAIAFVFIAALAVLLGWTVAVGISRGRTLERLQDATGAPSVDDVERLVRDALEQAETARWQRSAERWERRAEHRGSGGVVFGALLIVVGAVLAWHTIDPGLDLNLAWAVAIVAFGVFLVISSIERRGGA